MVTKFYICILRQHFERETRDCLLFMSTVIYHRCPITNGHQNKQSVHLWYHLGLPLGLDIFRKLLWLLPAAYHLEQPHIPPERIKTSNA